MISNDSLFTYRGDYYEIRCSIFASLSSASMTYVIVIVSVVVFLL